MSGLPAPTGGRGESDDAKLARARNARIARMRLRGGSTSRRVQLQGGKVIATDASREVQKPERKQRQVKECKSRNLAAEHMVEAADTELAQRHNLRRARLTHNISLNQRVGTGLKGSVQRQRYKPLPPPPGSTGGYISKRNPLQSQSTIQNPPTTSPASEARARRARPPPPKRNTKIMPPPRGFVGAYKSFLNPLEFTHSKGVSSSKKNVTPRASGKSIKPMPPPSGTSGAYRNILNPLADVLER